MKHLEILGIFPLLACAACSTVDRQPLATVAVPAQTTNPAEAGNRGALEVYTRFETGPASPGEIDSYNKYYSDYTISGAAIGQLHVVNRGKGLGDDPAEVELPAGEYTIMVRGERNVPVNVPVKVQKNHRTVVYLQQGNQPSVATGAGTSEEITTTSGTPVGWEVVY